MKETDVSKQELWKDFVSRRLLDFLKELSHEDLLQNAKGLIEQQEKIAVMRPIQAIKVLRQYMSERAAKKFSDRFRAEQYRKKNKKKTLQLNESTHQRLLKFKELLYADTMDEVLEYAMSPRYEEDDDIKEAKRQMIDSNADVETERSLHIVSDATIFAFKSLLRRLSRDDKDHLHDFIKLAYLDAWEQRGELDPSSQRLVPTVMTEHPFFAHMEEDNDLKSQVENDRSELSRSPGLYYFSYASNEDDNR
jgi:tRNA nucleotidyltransferase/poly(A) polymerase